MKNHTTFQKRLNKSIVTLSTLAILSTTSVFSQITPNDWVIQKITANRSSNAVAKNSVKTKISLTDFYSKMSLSEQTISLPNPSNVFENFIIKPSEIIDTEVAHLYTIKTFTGHKIGDPTTLIACDIDQNGFHAAVYTAHNTYFIEPESDSGDHIIFYKNDKSSLAIACNVKDHDHDTHNAHRGTQSQATTLKRNYRLAVTADVEYAQQFGGSPYSTTNVLNAIASGVNLMRPVYLRDLGVSFTLVTNANLIFTTKTFDTTDQDNILDNIHNKIVQVVGQNSFDIGHLVIWDNLGGVAYKGVACDPNSKGGGYSASNHSESTLWVDYVCHEIGHQFGSNHNFTATECSTSADGFRYEPGEGSSIMSYANVCGDSAQYQSFSDPYFHYASIEQMHNYMKTTSCATTDASGNSSDPIANAKADITIPKQTPFILVGSATDANDAIDQLSYGWQQYDGSGLATSGFPNCASTNNALFRFRAPSTVNYRSFPSEADVTAGNNNAMDWEKLPCSARTLNFSMTVRDNNASFGRITDDKMKVTVANTGPFEITSPNGGESLTGASQATVTWSVNGTDAHCNNVDIIISTDGFKTQTTLSSATANDGTETITLPNINTSTARIIVQCSINGEFRSASTFYDITNTNFTIEQSLSIAGKDGFSGLQIYPNPASDFITISSNENLTVKLFNINSITLIHKNIQGTESINTSSLISGLYFLEIVSNETGNKTIKKIIIK